MARNDGIDRTVARNQDLETPADVAKVQEHNEREKDSYSNQDIVPERTSLNVHFKAPTDDYVKMFEQMEQDGVISTRGLKPDAVKYGELVFDVNSAYFYNHGGYEFAKQFYADAYKAAAEIVGGEQYILSAVMHADERNRAMSEALGEDVYHYHLHVVYIPVVEKQRKSSRQIFTGNYQYWYKEERKDLFNQTQVVRNIFYTSDYVPKLGTVLDTTIFKKITDTEGTDSVYAVSRVGEESVSLNRREAFWMKAYREKVDDPEYKVFSFPTKEEADYCYCLINSSLFWWYWICTSDCWHVSKELNGFRAPFNGDYAEASELAKRLMDKLEETKVFVGTKQTDYEYKHRECLAEIHAIDDYINEQFGLTKNESEYIKGYALRYRTSGGAKIE